MPESKCFTCGRSLLPGDNAWASDWIVIEADTTRTVTHYTCDDCEAKR